LYQSWSPYVIEAWIRRGPTFAMMPIYRELFSNKKKPFKGPDHKALSQSLLRLAATSQILRDVRDKILDNPALSDGQKAYIKSFDGLFAEYDALVWLYESTNNTVPTENIWHFPAPPNLDVSPKNAVKGDIVSVRFMKGETVGFRLYDVKTKPISKHFKQIGQVTRLTLDDIGDLFVKDGVKRREAGHQCDEFLNDYLEVVPDRNFSNQDRKIALVASILNIHIPAMDEFLENSTRELPEDDPEIVKELGNWAIK
jgi:hypothetical protein